MPEYPDITVYIERLNHFILQQRIEKIRISSPFFLRTAEPPLSSIEGRGIQHISRLGKRIVFDCGDDLFLMIHLMISGRLHWEKRGCAIPPKRGLAALDFDNGTLLVTEAATQKRASLHLIAGKKNLDAFDRGGVELFEATEAEFKAALLRENHTLKRALTDPRLISGVGNAYSDEILHRARLSPVLLTQKMTDEQIGMLFNTAKHVLQEWTDRLRNETGEGFPKKVTAFHDEMAVHGKFGKPCPDCGNTVQRIRYAANETNYCPHCQTEGKLLADRSLSRLLKDDWPRTPEALEERLKNSK